MLAAVAPRPTSKCGFYTSQAFKIAIRQSAFLFGGFHVNVRENIRNGVTAVVVFLRFFGDAYVALRAQAGVVIYMVVGSNGICVGGCRDD